MCRPTCTHPGPMRIQTCSRPNLMRLVRSVTRLPRPTLGLLILRYQPREWAARSTRPRRTLCLPNKGRFISTTRSPSRPLLRLSPTDLPALSFLRPEAWRIHRPTTPSRPPPPRTGPSILRARDRTKALPKWTCGPPRHLEGYLAMRYPPLPTNWLASRTIFRL